MTFRKLKVGDEVTRMVGGVLPMPLTVTEVDDRFIHCGDWKFDRVHGYEVDEELGWGIPFIGENGSEVNTGSWLKLP